MILLTRLGSGKYSDIFKVQNGDQIFVMKVSYYREESVKKFMKKIEEGDERGARKAKDEDAISIASKFSEVAKKMETYNVTPHFLSVYESKDVKNFIEKIPILEKRFKELSHFQRKYNHVSFMNLYDTDLTIFLTKANVDDNMMRCIIFKIIYSIFSAQTLLKDWRHNDLSTNNVLIKMNKNLCVLSYTFEENTFFTKSAFDISIIDYDFVYADVNKLRNHRVTNGRFKLSADRNASYDVHFFLKSVFKCITKNERAKVNETIKFLKSIDLKDQDRQDVEIPSLFPKEVLKNSYFKNLKKEVKNVTKKYVLPL